MSRYLKPDSRPISVPYHQLQIETLLHRLQFRHLLAFTLGLKESPGHIARDFQRLVDGTPLGNQTLDVIGGGKT